MRKKLIFAVVLVIVIAVPVVIAALQQSQTIHVSKTYNPPSISPTPTPTANPTTNPSTNTAELKFSLFFPNGSVYVMDQDHVGSIYGAQNLDVNGIPAYVQSEWGAPPMGYPMGVIVVRNDGNVPLTVQAALANVNAPSDIDPLIQSYRTDPSLWGTQLSGWMGYNNYASDVTVEPGQYIWLSVCVTLMSNVQGNGGVIRNHAAFDYSFDVVVTAVQA